MQITFIESQTFSKNRNALLGNDDAYRVFQDLLLENPRAGIVIPGTGGLRKIRVRAAGDNRGKRGGLRVIYLYLEERARIVFFAVYAKNVADDLTPEQKKALASAAQQEKEREI